MEQFIFQVENLTRDSDDNDVITIKGEEHFHLSRVLRAKIGDKVLATDGKGMTCLCVIQQIEKDASTCGVVEEFREMNSSRRRFCIGMAVLKPISRLEFAIEKCTELGARNFLLFNTERSDKVNLRVERMAGVVRSAVKQSLQSIFPELAIVKNLEEVAAQSHVYQEKFVLHEKSNRMVGEYLSRLNEETSVIALIGPEGGFSEKEIDFLIARGFKSISVGKSRLRSETAAVKIASLLATY
jgi:16S rRNA (uracil1498-N3)-methyltransferase